MKKALTIMHFFVVFSFECDAQNITQLYGLAYNFNHHGDSRFFYENYSLSGGISYKNTLNVQGGSGYLRCKYKMRENSEFFKREFLNVHLNIQARILPNKHFSPMFETGIMSCFKNKRNFVRAGASYEPTVENSKLEFYNYPFVYTAKLYASFKKSALEILLGGGYSYETLKLYHTSDLNYLIRYQDGFELTFKVQYHFNLSLITAPKFHA